MNSSKPNPAARNRWSVVAVVFVSALVVVMVQAAAGQTLTTLYSFSGGEDGGSPNPVVVDGQGNLYGTTGFGGFFDCNRSTIDCGTAFELTPTGTKTVLHSFGAGDFDILAGRWSVPNRFGFRCARQSLRCDRGRRRMRSAVRLWPIAGREGRLQSLKTQSK